MDYLQTVCAHKIRNKCMKFKYHERNTTVSSVQSGGAKLKGLYIRYLGDGIYLRAVFSV